MEGQKKGRHRLAEDPDCASRARLWGQWRDKRRAGIALRKIQIVRAELGFGGSGGFGEKGREHGGDGVRCFEVKVVAAGELHDL